MKRRNDYNRKQTVKKERAIMIVSSAFVLTALTLTGVYVKNNNKEEQYDGYTVDFSSLEDSVDEKHDEISRSVQEMADESKLLSELQSVDSGDVEIPGLTDKAPDTLGEMESNPDVIGDVELAEAADLTIEEPMELPEDDIVEEGAPKVETHPALQYKESQGLSWPVNGEIIIDYSMDETTYFATLNQYKCSSGLVIAAEEGTPVCAAASGQVIYVFQDAEIGTAVAVDLGNGYTLTYGQLENVTVLAGSYLNAGDSFATVAKPTKYYSVEGSNLYFEMTKDGAPIDPLSLLAEN